MNCLRVSLVLLALAFSARASIVPFISPSLMPPEDRPLHDLTQFPAMAVLPTAPVTLDQLEAAHLSGPLYQAIKRLIAPTAVESLSTATDESFRPSPVPSPLLTAGGTVNASTDALQDAETTIVAFDKDGATHTVTAAMKYTPNTSIGLIYAHSSTSLAIGSFTHQQLPIPLDPNGHPYVNSGDPVLAANVYTGGVWGKRVYCAGMLFTAAINNGQFYLPSSIGLWHSDDGGQNWSSPSGVTFQSGGGLLTDKPTVAVSYYLSTLGDVYVAWVVRNLTSPTSSSLRVSRSTNGGASFETPAIVSFDNVEAPSLAVDANTGTVYVVWVNWQYGDIRVAHSSGSRLQPLSFGPHAIISSGNLSSGTLNGGIRAETVPAARYNWYAYRLIVVWHQRSLGGSDTDVFYSFYPCQGSCNSFSWQVPIQLSTNPVRDQFMPALDYNYDKVLVSFYDRRDDPSNLLYQEYVAELNSNGTGLQNLRVSPWASDPTLSSPNWVDPHFIGDYQDAWTWPYLDGTFLASGWIGIPAGGTVIGDAYVTRTAP